MSDRKAYSVEQLIAAALFDFSAWLTTRDATLTLGAAHDTAPMMEVLEEWASQRALDLGNAPVENWNEEISVPRAMRTLREAFVNDSGFALAWVANAVCMIQELAPCDSDDHKHSSWNEATELACRILGRLFSVDTEVLTKIFKQ